MEKLSIYEKSSLEKVEEKKQITHRIVEGVSYGEQHGYDWWWEIHTMGGKVYKISEQMKEAISKSEAKFFTMPKGEVIAAHQITEIVKGYQNFGPRAGEA